MTAQELLDNAYTVYKGKIASRTPVWGSDKANIVLSIANRKQREWATDPRNKWNSLFENRSAGTISTSTLTYDLDEDFNLPSDFARIIRTDDSITDYPIVKAQQRNEFAQALYISGRDPKTISFAQAIDTALASGTLYVPGYFIPDPIVNATDVIAVDDPNWLVYIVASELARNDPAKDADFSTLVGMANDIYTKMSNANNDVGFLQPNSVATNMPAMGEQIDDWATA